MNILTGDIGGTNSRLAIFDVGSHGCILRTRRTYPSAEFACAAEIIGSFLEVHDASCDAACLGVPGPVSTDGVIRLTNLPWTVDRARIRHAVGTEMVILINDVEASAVGVHGLASDEPAHPESLECLQAGRPDPSGHRAVISVGTGLGVAGLTASGRGFATEAGHAGFSPRTDFDDELLRTLRGEFGHVSWERLASGPALPRIYAFLAGSDATRISPPEVVGRYALDPTARETLAVFSRYLGAAAGNIALSLMATGGVYLCGGVAPRIIDAAGAGAILQAFVDKGRMRHVLERIPIYLVRDDDLALKGAARTAREELESARQEGRGSPAPPTTHLEMTRMKAP